jgi:hypothetical protein
MTTDTKQGLQVEILHPLSGWVYRLWAGDGACLYVGQTMRALPIRPLEHHEDPWWAEVVRCDCFEVRREELDAAEREQIHQLHPRHNIVVASVPHSGSIPERSRKRYWPTEAGWAVDLGEDVLLTDQSA